MSESLPIQNYWQYLFTSEQFYVVRTDLLGRYISANPHFSRRFHNEQQVDSCSSAFESILPEDWEKTKEVVQRCLAAPGVPQKVTLRKPLAETGEIIWTDWDFVACIGPDGAPNEILCIGIDASERVSAREHVRTLQHFLEEIIHDLKSPFSSLEIAAYMIEKLASLVFSASDAAVGQLTETASAGEIADRLHRNADSLKLTVQRLRELTESLRLMTRMETSTYMLHTAHDLNALVRSVVGSFGAMAEQRRIDLMFELDPELAPFTFNAQQIARAVQNLVENALKYTPDGGHITIHTMRRQSECWMSVIDTGIGINEHDLPYIFERRYRGVDAALSTLEGAGLGLSLVKQIVAQHSGHIDVYSIPGRGTTFRVMLPIR